MNGTAVGGRDRTAVVDRFAHQVEDPPEGFESHRHGHGGAAVGDLLAALQAVEVRHGRERPYHHAPRTLDLDLLLHGDSVLRTPSLTLPHPRLHLRAFVLEPLAELAPNLILPGLGPLAHWRAAAADQVVERLSV